MKKLVIIITAVFFMAGYTASAQMMEHGTQQRQGTTMQNDGMMHQGMHNGTFGGTMNSGMHGNMMNGGMGMMQNGNCPGYGQMMNSGTPIDNTSFLINRLPNLKQQLSLDNNQVEKLFSFQTDFKKQQIDFQAELRNDQLKLNDLIQGTAPSDQIKKQLEAIAKTKIDQEIAAYETAGKMKALLTNDQKEKLESNTVQYGMMNNEWMQQCLNGFVKNSSD